MIEHEKAKAWIRATRRHLLKQPSILPLSIMVDQETYDCLKEYALSRSDVLGDEIHSVDGRLEIRGVPILLAGMTRAESTSNA